MNTIPDAALSQHIAVLSKTRKLPAYKRDPRRILCIRSCSHCGIQFPVAKKFPEARFCSRKCGLAATLPPDHNTRIARQSARKRGDAQRGRGSGKSYPKLYGRHAHRVVAERKLGRQLVAGEIVHHKDHNKANFDADNLAVTDRVEHGRIHHLGIKQSPEHVAKRVESTRKTKLLRRHTR